MSDVLRGFFTGPDNQSGEIGRVNWALSILAVIGCQIYALYQKQAFEPLAFGGALGGVLAAGGFGIAKKDQAAGSSS